MYFETDAIYLIVVYEKEMWSMSQGFKWNRVASITD